MNAPLDGVVQQLVLREDAQGICTLTLNRPGQFNAINGAMLDALWPTLAPGGTLLYATCSILRAENDAQVAAFLARTPDASLQTLDARFGRDTGNGSQRLPGEDGMDGFFYARIRKA